MKNNKRGYNPLIFVNNIYTQINKSTEYKCFIFHFKIYAQNRIGYWEKYLSIIIF